MSRFALMLAAAVVLTAGADEFASVRGAIEAEVRAACEETAALQAKLSDRCRLTDYRSLVKATPTGEVWTAALQRAVDEHEIVVIPAAAKPYLLDGSVIIPSNRRIEAAGAVIRLVEGTRTLLLRNRGAADGTLAPIPSGRRDSNIAVVGGRWEECCTRRLGNGLTGAFNLGPREIGNFYGVTTAFYFGNCDHLTLRDVTFFHAGSFAVQVGDADACRFENVVFDHCFADGLHLNGNVTRVLARNVRGNVGDDLIALNAYDWANSSVNFGPQRAILCEDLELVRVPDMRWYPAIRILPARYRYADGTKVDCSVSDVIFRRVKGITTFKMYLQTGGYTIGEKPKYGEVGSGGNLFFEDIEIDLRAPIDNGWQYYWSDAPRGHFGAFEFGANLSLVVLRNIDITFHADKYPLTHLATVGPKSMVALQKDWETRFDIFDPYVTCRVERVVLDGIRTRGAVPKKLVYEAVFDNVNGDGCSSGRGEIVRLDARGVVSGTERE